MAFSNSARKGQIPVGCQLCETGESIQYKCVNCNYLLCHLCKLHHLKMKTSKDHKIIDLKEIGHHEIEIDFSNIPCDDHSGKTCCLFCQHCDCLVCPICITKIHNKHDLIEIKDAYGKKSEELVEQRIHMEKVQKEATRKLKELEAFVNEESTKIGMVRNDILNHEKNVKLKIEKHSKALLNELSKTETNLQEFEEKEKGKITAYISEVQSKNAEIETLVKFFDATKFFTEFQNAKQLKPMEKISETKAVFECITEFIPNDIERLGELNKRERNVKTVKKFEIVNQQEFRTKFELIGFMVQDPKIDDRLWVCSQAGEPLLKMKVKDSVISIENKLKVNIYGIVLLSEKEMLLGVLDARLSILNIETGEIIKSTYDTEPLRPSAVHVTKDMKIVIGAVDVDYPKPGRRSVIIMDQNGRKTDTYELDNNDKAIFTYPRRITSTRNGNIHVADFDYLNTNHGKIIVVGSTGKVITKYTGHSDINRFQPFIPAAILATPSDNVIVADCNSNALHILDNTGQLLTTYNTTEGKGIIGPYSFALLGNDNLYIGCTTAKGAKKDAKVYKVKVSGLYW